MYNTCIIKNIDTENHIVLGVELAPNDTYEIPDNKRVKASNESIIITLISESKIQIGNGSIYFGDIGKQVNYLKSGIQSVSIDEINTTVEANNGVSGFKLSRSSSNVSLSTSFSDVLDISGKGEFFGLKFIFSNDEVDVKLIIDEVVIFDMPISELRSMNYESFSNTGLIRFFGGDQFGEFEFFPSFGLKYNSSLKIQVKKTVSWTIRKEFHHIFYSEE